LFLRPASYRAIKISIGKYSLSESLADFVRREIEINGNAILPVNLEHVDVLTNIPFPKIPSIE